MTALQDFDGISYTKGSSILKQLNTTDPGGLLREAEEAIRGNLQAHAAAIIHRYGELGHDPREAFGLLRRDAVSEDGALHAEKFYRTVSEEFASTRAAYRWRHLVALARVTASECGRPAAGMAEGEFAKPSATMRRALIRPA